MNNNHEHNQHLNGNDVRLEHDINNSNNIDKSIDSNKLCLQQQQISSSEDATTTTVQLKCSPIATTTTTTVRATTPTPQTVIQKVEEQQLTKLSQTADIEELYNNNDTNSNVNIDMKCKQELDQATTTTTTTSTTATTTKAPAYIYMNLETLAAAAATTPPNVHNSYEQLIKYSATQQYTAADNDAALNLTSMSQAGGALALMPLEGAAK